MNKHSDAEEPGQRDTITEHTPSTCSARSPRHPRDREGRGKNKTHTDVFFFQAGSEESRLATRTDNSPSPARRAGPLSCQTWNVLSKLFPSVSARRAFAHKRMDGFLPRAQAGMARDSRGEWPRLREVHGAAIASLGIQSIPQRRVIPWEGESRDAGCATRKDGWRSAARW